MADATTGGARADAAFAALSPHLALGLTRVPMSRHIGAERRLGAAPCRAARARHAGRRAARPRRQGRRLCAPGQRTRAIRVYTPHGGSLHYGRSSPVGFIYLTLEQVLMPRTELFLFESRYGRDTFTPRSARRARSCAWCTTASRRRSSPKSRRRPTRPTSCSSASCACSRASTCCSTRSRCSRARAAAVERHDRGRRAGRGAVPRPGRTARAWRRRSASPAPCRRAPPSRSAACWSRPRARSRCPTSCSRPPPPRVPLITTNVGGIPEIFGPQSAPPGSARRRRGARARDPRRARRPGARCVTKH